jgi:predicted secreted protein
MKTSASASKGFGLLVVLLVLVALGVVTGTGWLVHDKNNTVVTTPKPPVTTKTPTPTKDSTTVTATDADKGKTFTLAIGQTLSLQLASTYWTIDESSAPTVIKMTGQPVSQSTSTHPPGTGAGTVTAKFTALTTGTATINAHRVSCGEAQGCDAAGGSYNITVNVQ